MQFILRHLLTLLIASPVAGIGLLIGLPRRWPPRWIAIGAAGFTLLVALTALALFDQRDPAIGPAAAAGTPTATRDAGRMQFVQYVGSAAIVWAHYGVGIDGLSLMSVTLVCVVSVLAIAAAWDVTDEPREYFALILAATALTAGAIASLDLLLWLILAELTVVPLYALLGRWSGNPRRAAADRFLAAWLIGTVVLCACVVAIGCCAGTFDLLLDPTASRTFAQGAPHFFTARIVLGLMIVVLGARLGMAPLHGWRVAAAIEASAPVSLLFAALVPAVSGYGILRMTFWILPEAASSLGEIIAITGLVSLLYGGLCAAARDDLTSRVAYALMAEAGLILISIGVGTPAGLSAASFGLICISITGAMLAYVVRLLVDRAGQASLLKMGGLAHRLPNFWGFSAVAFLALLGLPGTCGFISHLLALLGVYQAATGSAGFIAAGPGGAAVAYAIGIFASLGLILSAVTVISTLYRVYFGGERPELRELADLGQRDISILAVFTFLLFLLGICPKGAYFNFTQPTLDARFHRTPQTP